MKKSKGLARVIIYSVGLAGIILYLLIKDNTTLSDQKSSVEYHQIIPEPTNIKMDEGILIMGMNSKIYYSSPELKTSAALLARDLRSISQQAINITEIRSKQADIQIELSDKLASSAYSIRIDKRIKVKAGSKEACSNALVTLAQICIKHAGRASFPKLSLDDEPQSAYRGLLLDVARQWHDITDIKQVIETCRWYKINYLQLHLTDDQSFTFPTKAFPDLPTPGRTYSLAELQNLEEFARDRGVTLIPELETPGHSSLMRKVEPLGLEGIHVINMLDEKVYEALDKLVGEMCSVFQSTPYFHIGADECWLEGVGETDEEKEYMAKHGLENHQDIYNHFIVRMNEIVKKHNKKTLVWEGFKGKGSANVPIPHDITVFAWESLYQRPDSLLANGYTVINASWKPLYIVPKRSWTPEYIHSWNLWRFENWWEITPAFTPIQVEPTNQVIGSQMCAWENQPQYDLPAIQWRLPAMSDRIWNPDKETEFENYQIRYRIQSNKLDKILYPFSITTEGLSYPGFIGIDQKKPYQFKSRLYVKGKSYRNDLTLRYTLDGSMPDKRSSILADEISISETTNLKIQAFNEKDQLVGYPLWYPLEKIQ
jgi:hexosaminidase